MDKSKRRKKILLTCLGVSLALHIIVLAVIYKNPFLMNASSRSTFTRNSQPIEETRSKILDEVLEHLLASAPKFQKPFDSEPLLSDTERLPTEEKISLASSFQYQVPLLSDPTSSFSFTPPAVNEEKNIDFLFSETSWDSPPFVIGKRELGECPTLPLSEEMLTPDLSIPYVSKNPEHEKDAFPRISHSAEPVTSLSVLEPTSYPHQVIKQENSRLKTPLIAFRSLNQPLIPNNKTPIERALPKIDSYSLPQPIATSYWDAHCDTEVQIMPDPEGEGYLFSVAVTPIVNLQPKKLKQNIYFLIDRSNSIDRSRYDSFKKATLRALASLKDDIHFNIIVFDRKIRRLCDKNLLVNKKTVQAAEEFLQQEDKGGLFAATEIYTLLGKLIPSDLSEDEVNTVFLFSDGNTLLNLKKQRESILKWTEKNNGNACIYTAAAGLDNNLTLLDLLSKCNRGSLIYSRTQAALPRKFVKAISALQTPLIKNVSFSASSPDIQLYPSAYCAPTLYNKPYVILGKAKKLSDFTLRIEGQNNEGWVRIKKEISFDAAKKGKAPFERRWALQDAHISYENFLKSGNGSHLKKAENILQVYANEGTF